MIKSLFIIVALTYANIVLAADITRIDGTFDGCDYDKVYGLIDGRILVCHEYHYFYAYSPEVFILDSNLVIIEKEKVSASISSEKLRKPR
jgi:hypothetical protein